MDEKKPKILGDMDADEVLRVWLLEGYPGLARRSPPHLKWRVAMEGGLLKVLPSDPRCIWCHAPFRGPGAPLMRAIGKDKSRYNPNLCNECETMVVANNASAEVDMALLFADIRGSTALAENRNPAEFSQLINRFYREATAVLVDEGAFIDKLAGDQVAAFFVSGLAGAQYHQSALRSAQKILQATGHNDPAGPWVPVGIGLHSGLSYFGAVGTPDGMTDITMLGDAANTAARLSSAAGPGEILVSETIAAHIDLDTGGLEKRRLELKGKSQAVGAWVWKHAN
ncbi:MAG: adenylate/guanylate cyclase domain-containing protein [Anaerolineales bacterium]|nr:adenylate/guanylate cyclase domain-containing protein [Anaerolineales bacterium]